MTLPRSGASVDAGKRIRHPMEMRYVFFRHPHLSNPVEAALKEGAEFAVSTLERTPAEVLSAINHIAVRSQHRMIITWLPPLVLEDRQPLLLESDVEAAGRDGIDLRADLELVRSRRRSFKRFLLTGSAEPHVYGDLLLTLNESLEPYALHYAAARMVFDNADQRTEIAQSIIKALLLIGPITHVLEMYTRGFGKAFAASMDDVMSEAAELFALRGSGFRWRQLARRGIILLPVFALATYGAFQVDSLIETGDLWLGGVVFGLSAVALSLTTAVQSIRMYHQCVAALEGEGKIPRLDRPGGWILALRQDFTNPARLGLFIGAGASPFVAMSVFLLLPSLLHNGWLLALLGTAETVTAGIVVLLSRRIHLLRVRRSLKKLLTPSSA